MLTKATIDNEGKTACLLGLQPGEMDALLQGQMVGIELEHLSLGAGQLLLVYGRDANDVNARLAHLANRHRDQANPASD